MVYLFIVYLLTLIAAIYFIAKLFNTLHEFGTGPPWK
jgi:hypothetical protein